jgi:hypothetical protein
MTKIRAFLLLRGFLIFLRLPSDGHTGHELLLSSKPHVVIKQANFPLLAVDIVERALLDLLAELR